MKRLNLLALGFGLTRLVLATETVDLTERLSVRNELTRSTRATHRYLYDTIVQERLATWLTHEKIMPYVVDCQFKLRPFFQSEKIIGPLCYLLRQDDKQRRAGYVDLVKRYLLEIRTSLQELAEDPRYPAAARAKAKEHLKGFHRDDITTIQKCFEPVMAYDYPKDG